MIIFGEAWGVSEVFTFGVALVVFTLIDFAAALSFVRLTNIRVIWWASLLGALNAFFAWWLLT